MPCLQRQRGDLGPHPRAQRHPFAVQRKRHSGSACAHAGSACCCRPRRGSSAGDGPYTVAIDGSRSGECSVGTRDRFQVRGANESCTSSMRRRAVTMRRCRRARFSSRPAKRVRGGGVPVEVETLHGVAARTIADGARQNDSVLIIAMGTHGRLGIARAALGSVAAAVIQHARLPVMVVRQPGT